MDVHAVEGSCATESAVAGWPTGVLWLEQIWTACPGLMTSRFTTFRVTQVFTGHECFGDGDNEGIQHLCIITFPISRELFALFLHNVFDNVKYQPT